MTIAQPQSQNPIFHPITLNRNIQSLGEPNQFLLNTYCTEAVTFDTEKVAFDKVEDKPRMAPLVSPDSEAPVVQGRGYQVNEIHPAYTKDERHIKPRQGLRRRVGETIGSGASLSPGDRIRLQVVEDQQDQIEMIGRLEEWMIAQQLHGGSVVLESEKHPRLHVDFGRHPDLTVALAGSSQWGENDVSVLQFLRSMGLKIKQHSGGVLTHVTMDPLAAEIFRDDPRVIKMLETRRGSTSTAELAPQFTTEGNAHIEFIGRFGTLNVWEYQEQYTNPFTGAVEQIMPDYSVVGGNPGFAEGVRLYGAIHDIDHMEGNGELIEGRYYSDSWKTKSPSRRILRTQSAPLPTLYRPNATFGARVRTQ